MNDHRKISVKTTNHFSVFSPDENATDSIGKGSSLDGTCERLGQIDDSNSNRHTTSYKKTNKMSGKNKLPVTVILGDSIVKDVKSYYLNKKNKIKYKNKIVVKHFTEAKTKDMESYIIPTLEQNPEKIIILGLTT